MYNKELLAFIKEVEISRTDDAGNVWVPKHYLTASQIEKFEEYSLGECRLRYPGNARHVSVGYDVNRAKAKVTEEALAQREAVAAKQHIKQLSAHVATLEEQLVAARDEQILLEAAAHSVGERVFGTINIARSTNGAVGGYDGHLAGTAVLSLSDLHFEESVDSSQVRGNNSYNIEVAQKRLDTVMESSANLLLNHSGGTYHDSIITLVNGDLVSGEIHDELTRTNSASLQETIFILANKLYLNFVQYSQNFRKVRVLFTPGNHGRMDHKWTAKDASNRSWDMMVGRILKGMVDANPQLSNVEVVLAQGADLAFDVYGMRCIVEHGNAIKTTGDAIAGFITSAVRRKLKLHEREAQMGRMKGDNTRGVDYLFIGHFHSLEVFRGVIANGSLIGTSEYSMQGSFRPEPPQQVLVNFHPEHGLNQIWAVQAQQQPAIRGAEDFRLYVG